MNSDTETGLTRPGRPLGAGIRAGNEARAERENPRRPGTRERERRRGRGPLVAVCTSLGRAR